MILRRHFQFHYIMLVSMVITASGCSVFVPLSSSPSNSCPRAVIGSVSETKTIITPIALIQATRAGATWVVTVSTCYAHDSRIQHDVLNGEGNAARVLRFRADSAVMHEVVPVEGGLVLLAQANAGWSESELRVTVVNANGEVIQSEVLK